MRNEIEAAARWFANALRSKDLSNEQLIKFEAALAQLLTIKYTNHWYAHMPWRGQGYRSIITDEYSIDKVLKKAARVADIHDLHKRMPKDSFVMWVDPGEVEVKYLRTSRTEVVYSSSTNHAAPPTTSSGSTSMMPTRPTGFSFASMPWQDGADVQRGNSFTGSTSPRILSVGEDDQGGIDDAPGSIFDTPQESGMKLPTRSTTPGAADRHDRLGGRGSGLYSAASLPGGSNSNSNVKIVKDARATGSSSIWDRSGIAAAVQRGNNVVPGGSTAASSSSKLNLNARPFFASTKTNDWAGVVKNVNKNS